MRNKIVLALGVAAVTSLFSARGASTHATAGGASARADFRVELATSYATTPAARAAVPPAACDTDAYVVDKDPKGLNVRDSPGAGGRVVAVIPADMDGTVVHLVSSNPNGWVQIDRAETIMGAVVFDKKGWVSGNMLGIETRGYGTRGVKLYAGGRGSKILGTIPPESEVKVAGCDGDRMRVRYKSLTGWLDPDSQCASPVTTCN
jgi:hypothetical protein